MALIAGSLWRRPSNFSFVINVRVAKALTLKISDNPLSLADEVVE